MNVSQSGRSSPLRAVRAIEGGRDLGPKYERLSGGSERDGAVLPQREAVGVKQYAGRRHQSVRSGVFRGGKEHGAIKVEERCGLNALLGAVARGRGRGSRASALPGAMAAPVAQQLGCWRDEQKRRSEDQQAGK